MRDGEFWNVIEEFLSGTTTASMATCDEQGLPHAVNLWYAFDSKFRLYFVSDLDSEHSRHVVRDPHVALTLYGPTDDPRHIHGLQIHGLCVPIPPGARGKTGDWELAWELYTSRFPFVLNNPFFRKAVLSQCFFRITPVWVRWLDNRKGFGFKMERRLDTLKPAGKRPPTRKRPEKKTKKSLQRTRD